MQELLKKIGLRDLHFMIIGVGAILTSAVAASLLVPEIKASRAASHEVRLLEEASRDGEQLERQLQEQQGRIDDLRHRLNGNMGDLPVQQVEAYIIGRLQKVSWDNGVELVSVEPTAGERVHVFEEILFKVQLVGRYDNLYRWLLEARDDLGYVVIKEYELTRRDSNDQSPLLLAELSLASYKAVE